MLSMEDQASEGVSARANGVENVEAALTALQEALGAAQLTGDRTAVGRYQAQIERFTRKRDQVRDGTRG